MPRRVAIGVVTSDKMSKTRVVEIPRLVKHAQYGKYIRRRAKFMAHDEAGECAVGDLVELVSSRPLSARKRWRVSRVVRKAIMVGGTEDP